LARWIRDGGHVDLYFGGLTLVVDGADVVDVAFGSADLAKDAYRDWVGRRWTDNCDD